MASSPDLSWQHSLLGATESIGFDGSFAELERIDLDDESWVDHAPRWVSGADRLFEQILAGRRWQRSRHMREHSVPKVPAAWPRISLAYRHGMDARVYEGKRIEQPTA